MFTPVQPLKKLKKPIKSKIKFRDHQIKGIDWLVSRPCAGLFFPPGAGKTLVSLEAIKQRFDNNDIDRVLIVAPKRVCYRVWPQQIAEWGYNFSSCILHGNKKDKTIEQESDIYLINPEGLDWLFKNRSKKIFNSRTWIIVDESSLFRNGRSLRSKILRRLLKCFKYRTILTGTPTPKGYEGLHNQIYILDQGERLGEYITHYRNEYFYPSGYGGYTYKLQKGKDKVIQKLISDIILSCNRDVLDMPPLTHIPIELEIPAKAMKVYKEMEKEFIIELENGANIVASTGAVAYGKCRQISSGAIYGEDKEITIFHNEKVEALKELFGELEGNSLMVMFNYTFEAKIIKKHFPMAEIIRGKTTKKELERIETAWNSGKLELLLLQPGAGGYGLNLQTGGCTDICWYSPNPDAELFEQAYSRVWRTGVKGGVRMHMLSAIGTVEPTIYKALIEKMDVQEALKNSLIR